jgi:hypothetical protein
MAIGTDAAIEFFGSKTLLGSTTSTVLNDAFSDGTNDLDAWTNADDAPQATLALEFTTATTGDANSVLNLYARVMNVGSADTEDSETPDANFQHTYLGSFPHNNPATGEQAVSIVVSLPNVSSQQVYEFFIENKTGQTISAGWELTIRPKTLGPHA